MLEVRTNRVKSNHNHPTQTHKNPLLQAETHVRWIQEINDEMLHAKPGSQLKKRTQHDDSFNIDAGDHHGIVSRRDRRGRERRKG